MTRGEPASWQVLARRESRGGSERLRDPRFARSVPWDSIGRLETRVPLDFRPVGVGSACADEGVLNMHIAAFVTVAIVVGFAAPTCANDRPIL
jgi:hypothetical protein